MPRPKSLSPPTVIKHRKEGTRCFVALRPELEKAFAGLLASILKFRKCTA
jgi:hypothetical protein